MQALGELKWLGIFICAYNIRSEVIVLFSISEDLNGTGGEEYPMDIWLLLASYIRPEDIVNFSLICKNAWTVTCTAAFWTRLYRRCDHRKLTMLSMWLISLFLIWCYSLDGDLFTFSNSCLGMNLALTSLSSSLKLILIHSGNCLPYDYLLTPKQNIY